MTCSGMCHVLELAEKEKRRREKSGRSLTGGMRICNERFPAAGARCRSLTYRLSRLRDTAARGDPTGLAAAPVAMELTRACGYLLRWPCQCSRLGQMTN